jgi:hypothetical protein
MQMQLVILVMSVTGILLAYRRQIINWGIAASRRNLQQELNASL